jgi:uncharacterized tellurite resistance protein B-like protein
MMKKKHMSIREFLGLPSRRDPGEGDTDAVRHVVEALDRLPEDQARFIAAFGYILGRVAHADMRVSPEETHAMEEIVMEQGGLSQEQAIIVVQMAKTRNRLFGGTENFLVTREFGRIATREQKLALLDCLFAVSAAEGDISMVEDNEIRQISSELLLEHREFIQVRSGWRDHLAVLKDLPARRAQSEESGEK